MIDTKTLNGIKDIKTFLESWGKFHQTYESIVCKVAISAHDEEVFFDTKALLESKYRALKEGLEYQYMPFGRLTDPVAEILALDTVACMSEKKLSKIEHDWKDSYVFLNNILERLKTRKRRLEHFSPLGVWLKHFFETIRGGSDDKERDS